VGYLEDLRNDENDPLGRLLAQSHRYDFQTGFLNYKPFEEALTSLLRNRLPNQQFVLMWIEVLNLRQEYLLRGAVGSDAMLRRLSESLRDAVDGSTLLGRFNGSALLAAMPAAKYSAGDRYQIQTVVNALKPAIAAAGDIRPAIVAGAAFYPADTESPADLIRFAGLAASRADSVKSSALIPFHPEMNDLVLRGYQMELDMRKGLEEGQFTTFYQPKIDLKTGRVLGAEAMMRWNHPGWGPVSPAEFIPIAERSRLIHRIFEHSLRDSLESARRWRDMGLQLPTISVNVSVANVRKEDFVRNVRTMLAEIPIAPTELELEGTESMLVEDEDLFDVRLRQLRSAGVCIAIDDFGTRSTSFNVLKHLPLSAMKIDRCFVHGIQRSENLRTLCRTIVSMARSLNLHTVAEGIEDPDEFDILRQIGCDAGQGFLFQRPIPEEEFTTFLRRWPARMHDFDFTEQYGRRTFFGT
jgi:EAL domain-containing protein (putative c-di-GMP-specific phosphodiesterase class I)/GGDEF domain-containing protein